MVKMVKIANIVEVPDVEIEALVDATRRTVTRDEHDALVSLLRRLAPEHEAVVGLDAHTRRAASASLNDRSTLPCRCGEHHLLGEFAADTSVVYAEERRPRIVRRLMRIGEVGVVVEWNQQNSSLYYRVEFPSGERENFDPCELRSVQ